MGDTGYVLAVEIGGTKLQMGLYTAQQEVLELRRGRVDPAGGAAGIIAWVEQEAATLFRHAATALGAQVRGAGIGFGGPIESSSGRVLVSHQIAGWQGFALKHWFEERFETPAVVANDANAAGWAEYCRGAGRGTRNFVYSNIGSGIGGALVVEGRLYDGQGLGACEIGHTWVPDWTRVEAGAADKLEHLCSGWAIERRLRGRGRPAAGSPLDRLCGGEPARLTCQLLGEAAREGDTAALEELEQVGNAVGLALANVITLLHPERVALGGGVPLMGEVLLEPVRRAVAAHVFGVYRDRYEIVACERGENVVLDGAALLAWDRVDGPG